MRKVILSRLRTWPGALSDGLILLCSICGERVDLDYNVEDVIWEKLISEEHRRSVVCLFCLDRIAEQENIELFDHIQNIQYAARGRTVILKPTKMFIYDNDNPDAWRIRAFQR